MFIGLCVSYMTLVAGQDMPAKPAMNSDENRELIKYTPDFRFNDGIYLNFDQVRSNNPIPKAKLLTSVDYNDREFFNKILENDRIYFYDDMGIRQEILQSDLWGYSRNGVLYVRVQESFNRITFVGNISHFVADVITYDSRYGDPYGYGYYDPYYYRYSNYYYPYSSYYNPYRQSNMSREEIKQYIIDFENGKVLEFDMDNTELILMKDAELHEEWVNLPRRKRKQLMFVYIRRFNEKNPLYIPE